MTPPEHIVSTEKLERMCKTALVAYLKACPEELIKTTETSQDNPCLGEIQSGQLQNASQRVTACVDLLLFQWE
jgi:shikimate kinase